MDTALQIPEQIQIKKKSQAQPVEVPVVAGLNLAHYKRLTEYLKSDPNFEQDFFERPQETLTAHGLDLDVKLLRPLWDLDNQEELLKREPDHPVIVARNYIHENYCDKIMIENLKDECFTNPHHASWRRRQLQISSSRFHKAHNDQLSHIPFAFELSRGCSGGCFFCALASQKLEEVFPFTSTNSKLWKDILEMSQSIIGPAARASICYWATDPLDNPDYESFAETFAEVMGCFPQTTTALYLRDIERTKNLLPLAVQYKRPYNRFSIVKLKQLHQLYSSFTPEELMPVTLVLNNPESKSMYSNCGRVRNRRRAALREDKVYQEGTSVCMSGFLVNMVDKKITLLTPVNPSDEYPNGMKILAEGYFDSASEYASCIHKMIVEHMPLVVPDDRKLSFRKDLSFEEMDDGINLKTRFMNRTFSGGSQVIQIGRLIESGTTLTDIIDELTWVCIPDSYVRETVNKFFQAGVLNDGF